MNPRNLKGLYQAAKRVAGARGRTIPPVQFELFPKQVPGNTPMTSNQFSEGLRAFRQMMHGKIQQDQESYRKMMWERLNSKRPK
jgi:hypothetical protein